MTALARIVAHDARLQWRYGIYAAYGAVIVLYVIVLRLAGPYVPDWAIAALIYSDPAVLGAFFLGGLMLLERGEGIRMALAITPITPALYLWGKTMTLTATAVLAVTVLGLAHGAVASWPLLLTGVVLISIQFIGLGVPLALRFRTVSGYLIGSAGLLAPVVTPGLLALIPDMPVWLALVPAVAQFRLTLVAFGFAAAGPIELALMLGISTLAAMAMLVVAHHLLSLEFGRG